MLRGLTATLPCRKLHPPPEMTVPQGTLSQTLLTVNADGMGSGTIDSLQGLRPGNPKSLALGDWICSRRRACASVTASPRTMGGRWFGAR